METGLGSAYTCAMAALNAAVSSLLVMGCSSLMFDPIQRLTLRSEPLLDDSTHEAVYLEPYGNPWQVRFLDEGAIVSAYREPIMLPDTNLSESRGHVSCWNKSSMHVHHFSKEVTSLEFVGDQVHLMVGRELMAFNREEFLQGNLIEQAFPLRCSLGYGSRFIYTGNDFVLYSNRTRTLIICKDGVDISVPIGGSNFVIDNKIVALANGVIVVPILNDGFQLVSPDGLSRHVRTIDFGGESTPIGGYRSASVSEPYVVTDNYLMRVGSDLELVIVEDSILESIDMAFGTSFDMDYTGTRGYFLTNNRIWSYKYGSFTIEYEFEYVDNGEKDVFVEYLPLHSKLHFVRGDRYYTTVVD